MVGGGEWMGREMGLGMEMCLGIIIIIIIIGEIPDAGHWVLYAQILIVRDGAPPCSKNEQADSTTLYPVWIQTSEQ